MISFRKSGASPTHSFRENRLKGIFKIFQGSCKKKGKESREGGGGGGGNYFMAKIIILLSRVKKIRDDTGILSQIS